MGIPLATSLVGLGIGIAASRGVDGDGGDGEGAALVEGALMDLRDGSLTMGLPLPRPVLLPEEEPGGRGWRTALGVTLFRATF